MSPDPQRSDSPRSDSRPASTAGGYAAGPFTELFDRAAVHRRLQDWDPFPMLTDRASWDAVPPGVAGPILAAGEAAATADWPALPVSLWTAFRRVGDREGFETPYFERRRQLVELVSRAGLTGTLDDATVDRLWALCEETSWCLPPHDRLPSRDDPLIQLTRPLPDPATPVPDLFATQTGAQLALARHVLRPALDQLSPVLADRIAREVDQRVVTPYLERDDWRWLGRVQPKMNNWNPWINLNVLVAGLLVVRDPARRARLVERIGQSLDAYLACMPVDGGCTEGQNYWTVAAAKVMDVAQVVRAVTGIDATQLPQLVAAARYPLAMHIHGPRMVQHADGPARWDQDPHLLHRYGRAVGNDDLVRLAAHLRGCWQQEGQGRILNLWDRLNPLLDIDYLTATNRDHSGADSGDDSGEASGAAGERAEPAPYIGLSWFDSTEVLSVRQHPGRLDGLFLVAKGGHNDEEHNHNDVGSFSIALDGDPLVVDAGVNTYTAQTFGPRRYELWTMQSGWHNLPVVNGHDQGHGRQFRATAVSPIGVDRPDRSRVGLQLELAEAWPAAAGLRSWRRQLVLDRDTAAVELTDAWQLSDPASLTLGLVLAVEPELRDGATDTGGLTIAHPGLTATVEVQPIPDGDRLQAAWGNQLWRLVLIPQGSSAEGAWTLRFSRRG